MATREPATPSSDRPSHVAPDPHWVTVVAAVLVALAGAAALSVVGGSAIL